MDTHSCMHAHTRTHARVQERTRTHTHTHTHTHAHMYTHMYTRTHVHTCTHTCTHVHTHTHTCTHTYTHGLVISEMMRLFCCCPKVICTPIIRQQCTYFEWRQCVEKVNLTTDVTDEQQLRNSIQSFSSWLRTAVMAPSALYASPKCKGSLAKSKWFGKKLAK